jgi:transcriptional regulator with XRE-family HTH domain
VGEKHMSNIGNKEVMSSNLKYYIEKSGKDRRELAEIWGFPYSTVTEWINGKKYPRIDRIEVMADYFGILKSDLIEKKTEEHKKIQEKNDAQTDVVVRMRTDNDFFSIVEGLTRLDSVQLASVKQIVDAFLKD